MRLAVAALVVATALAPACSDGGGSSAVAPTPQTIEGTWRATRALFVSTANSSRQVDIVAQGSTVTMAFTGNNYTFTQSEPGEPAQVQTGTWSASSEVMTLRPTGVTWQIQFDMTFSGNNLTLNGGHVQFDFNSGVFEEAILSMTLVRQ